MKRQSSVCGNKVNNTNILTILRCEHVTQRLNSSNFIIAGAVYLSVVGPQNQLAHSAMPRERERELTREYFSMTCEVRVYVQCISSVT